jgi:N-methylhydantoinase A
VTRLVDARYPGQSHELTVDADGWEDNLAEAHQARYGFRFDAEPQMVTRRLLATARTPAPLLTVPGTGYPGSRSRRAFVDGEWLDVPVRGPGATVSGPAIVELPGATCLVRPGWAGEPDAADTLVLERTWTR